MSLVFDLCCAGDYGCTQALQRGHGLTVLQQQGSGKAVSLTSRSLAASAGMFVGGKWWSHEHSNKRLRGMPACRVLV